MSTLNKQDIKIFISYHKETEIVESSIMTPIHVGARCSDIALEMITDDTGDNISDKNDRFCELTAQYWAWKNVDAKYYGFMHYRRHFVFDENENRNGDSQFLFFKEINRDYKNTIGLHDDSIIKCVEGYDLVLPIITDTSTWGASCNEVQFSSLSNLHAKDFETVCDVVCELFPEYKEAVLQFRCDNKAYWYNMFIMRKEIFFAYCEWLFKVLQEAERRIDFSCYDQQEKRTLAFMAERLQTIFINRYLEINPNTKVKFLKMTYIDETSIDTNHQMKKLDHTPYVLCIKKAYDEIRSIKLPYDMKKVIDCDDILIDALISRNDSIIYGAGDWCMQILSCFDELGLKKPVEIWDINAKEKKTIKDIPLVRTVEDKISVRTDKVWIVSIKNKTISATVVEMLKNNGVEKIITQDVFLRWMNVKMLEKDN